MASRQGTANEPYLYPSRAHPNGAVMVKPALNRALSLVGIVREEDANAVARVLDPLSWEQMAAVIVVLAAMVPDDRTVEDLTAWVHEHRADLRIVR